MATLGDIVVTTGTDSGAATAGPLKRDALLVLLTQTSLDSPTLYMPLVFDSGLCSYGVASGKHIEEHQTIRKY